jgi:hypothetical protein
VHSLRRLRCMLACSLLLRQTLSEFTKVQIRHLTKGGSVDSGSSTLAVNSRRVSHPGAYGTGVAITARCAEHNGPVARRRQWLTLRTPTRSEIGTGTRRIHHPPIHINRNESGRWMIRAAGMVTSSRGSCPVIASLARSRTKSCPASAGLSASPRHRVIAIRPAIGLILSFDQRSIRPLSLALTVDRSLIVFFTIACATVPISSRLSHDPPPRPERAKAVPHIHRTSARAASGSARNEDP